MNHLYADFAKETDLKYCFFHFVRTAGGHYLLDDIYNKKHDVTIGEVLSYDECFLKRKFLIKYKKGSNLCRQNFKSIEKEIIKNRKL